MYTSRLGQLTSWLSQDESLQNASDPALEGRKGEMMAGVAMFLDNPLLGIGFGHYPLNFQQYSLNNKLMVRGSDRPAHSLYLETAAERGVIGLIVLATLMVMVARNVAHSRRRLKRMGNTDGAHLVDGFGLGFLLYMVAATFLHAGFARPFWAYIAVALTLCQLRTPLWSSGPNSRREV
jgi:O-antigen ligase